MVLHVKIRELPLENSRRWLLANALCARRTQEEKLMNLTPWHVVADGHGNCQDHSLLSRQAAIVRRASSEQHRVRQSDLLLSRSSQVGCMRPEIDAFALDGTYAHVVAWPHAFRIDDEQATDNLIDKPD